MKKVGRYVNLFELKLGHRYKNNNAKEVVDAVDFGTVLSRTNNLPLGALASVEGSSRYWKNGPTNIFSNRITIRFAMASFVGR